MYVKHFFIHFISVLQCRLMYNVYIFCSNIMYKCMFVKRGLFSLWKKKKTRERERERENISQITTQKILVLRDPPNHIYLLIKTSICGRSSFLNIEMTRTVVTEKKKKSLRILKKMMITWRIPRIIEVSNTLTQWQYQYNILSCIRNTILSIGA